MRISIDLDGVVANFVRRVAEMTGLSPDYQPPDWDFSDVLTKEQLSEVFKTIRTIDDFWSDLPTYPDNVQSLQEFLKQERGHEIYYLTSRISTKGNNVSDQTEEWLFDNVQSGVLYYKENFQAVIAVDSAAKKRCIIEALNIEVSVDDYGPTIEQCSTIPNHKAFLLDRPWNRDKDYGNRIFNLEQFFNVVTGKKPADYFMV